MKIKIPRVYGPIVMGFFVKPAFRLYGLDFVSIKYSDNISIVERSTGRQVGKTISEAKKFLRSKGKKLVLEQVSKHEKLNK